MQRRLNFRLIAGLLGGLLLAGVGVHFLHGYQLQRNAYRLLERGDCALSEKDLAAALGYYGQYLEFVPNDADTAQKYAAVLDRRANNVADRVRLILLMEQVLRVKPGEHAFRLRLVHNLIALDRVADAVEQLRKLQAAWPDRAEVLHMLGWCHDALKEYAPAVQAFEAAIQANPKQLKSYRLLGEVLQDRLNQPDEALKIMDEMVRANADSCDAYLWRGQFHRRRGNAKLAQIDLEQAHKLGPERADVILEVANAVRSGGDWRRAGQLLEDGLRRHPQNAAFYLALARDEVQRGKHADAIARLEIGLGQAPQSTEIAVLLVDLLIDQRRFAEARARIDGLLKDGMRPALPYFLQARLQAVDKRWSQAVQLAQMARQELDAASEWHGRVNVLLGVCHRALGDAEQELRAFRQAARDQPDWIVAGVGLGAALLNNGRIEDAVQALEPWQKSTDLPPGFWTLLSRARLYRQWRLPEAERQWDDVESALAQAARAEPSGPDVPLVRAEYLAGRGDFAAAQTLLEKTKQAHPGAIAIWCALADLAAKQNRFEAAERTLEEAGARQVFAQRHEWRIALARLWAKRGTPADRAKLIALAERAPAAADDRVRFLRELADAWARLGDWDRAAAFLRDLTRALPQDLASRARLFDDALQRGQTAAARAWLDDMRAIEPAPGENWRCAEVALLIHEAHGRRGLLQEAREKLAEIERAHKESPRVAFLSGTINELERNYQQAVVDYSNTLKWGDTQPRVLAALLRLLLQRREFGKAEAEVSRYEQALPLTPNLARLGAEAALGMRDRRYAKIAVQRASQAVALPPRDYRDALWLARIHQAAGENDRAESLLRAALEQAGHAPDAWIAWMGFLAQTNRRADGAQELERMRKALPARGQTLTRARCWEALGWPDRAERAYQAALRETPDDFVALSYAADFYRRADRAGEARRAYERLLDPALAAPAELATPARRHLAVLLGLAGEIAQAHDLLDAVRATRGDTLADRRIRLFLQSLSAQARADAILRFQESLRQQLPSPDERLLLAQMLESADHLGQARTVLSLLADESPAPLHLARYARLLIRLEEWAEAERAITRLDELEPSSARVRRLRAMAAEFKE